MLPPEMIEEKCQELVGKRAKRQRFYKRLLLFGVCAMLALVLATGAAYVTMRRGSSQTETTLGSEATDDQVTVLVMGADIRPNDTGRSDTMMLASFQPTTGRVGIMSIPRDTRVRIPGHRGYSRINAAFALGGAELVSQTVSNLLHVDIDYYVVLDFAGFEKVVDLLGGVVLNVSKRMYYVDRAQRLIIDLKPGTQRLDGKRALGYVRFRHDQMGDISLVDPNSGQYEGRVERQLNFVKAVAKQALRPENIIKAPKLLKQVYAALDTDIPFERMVSLALSARRVRPEKVQTFVLPGSGAKIGGVSYWLLDEKAANEVVIAMAGNQSQERSPVRVAVLNGSGISGVAGKAADKLRQEGYEVVSVGNANQFNYEHTEVIAQTGDPDAASMVAKALGVKVPRRGKDTSYVGNLSGVEVAVIVGRDISSSLARSN